MPALVAPCQPALVESGLGKMGGKRKRKTKTMKIVMMIESDDKFDIGL